MTSGECAYWPDYSLFFLTWPLSYPKTDDNNIEQGQNPGAKLKGLFGHVLLLHLSGVDKQSILDNKWQ